MSGPGMHKGLRVLHVTSTLDPRAGGVVSALEGMAIAQAKAGISASVLATWRMGQRPASMSLQSAGVSCELVGPAYGPASWHGAIRRTCRQLVAAVDVVHIHALWEEVQFQAALTAQEMGKPYIISPHGMLDPWSLSQKRLKKQLYMRLRLRSVLKSAAALHFTTCTERGNALGLGLPGTAIIEALGLWSSDFTPLPERGEFRATHRNLGTRPLVLFLGRLHHKKGLELLIPAFAKGGDPSACLVIAGPDSDGYAARLKLLAERHGIGDRVLFTGMLRGRERLQAWVDSDFFVLPSYQENFGMAVVESLACGCPVVLSDQVQIHRELADGGVALVTGTDVDSVANAIGRWSSNSSDLKAAAERARPFVMSRYEWGTIGQRWVEHYGSLVGSKPAPAPVPPRSPGTAPETRVLHVINTLDPEYGGPVTALAGLASAQRRLGQQVAVAAGFYAGESTRTAEALRDRSIEVSLLGPTRSKLGLYRGMARELRPLIERADVVHIHGVWQDIHHRAARIASELGKPYVLRPCGMLDPWSLGQHALRKSLYLALRLRRDLAGASGVHFTAELERDLTRPLGMTAPALVVPNGLDTREFAKLPERGSFRKRWPQIGERPMVLFLSRIHPKKGLDLLLPAFARAQEELAGNAVLVVAGPDADKYEASVRTIASDLGIAGDVVFCGPLYGQEKLAVYHDADVFALPSYQENFGNVIIEALACGCPVIISDRVNIWREIERAGVGWVTSTNIVELAERLRRALGPGEQRKTMAAQARSFAMEHYDWDHIARTWAWHYAELAGKKGPSNR